MNYPNGIMRDYHRSVFRRHKRRKYRNHKIYADGHKFDSKVEYDYYELLKAKGATFRIHRRYTTLPHYVTKSGIKCRKHSYTPDFVLYRNRYDFDHDNPYEVIDVKGINKIPSYDSLRFSLFERKYDVRVVIARKRHGRWIYEKKEF